MTSEGKGSRPPKSRVEQPPENCPTCGQYLTEYPYYQVRANRPARILRRIAILLLPVMALAYLVQLFWGSAQLGFGTGHGYWALLFIGGPSLLLYTITRLFPKARIIICPRCSWNREYPFGDSAS